MKVYIASSWKNVDRCEKLKQALEDAGIAVSLFSWPGHRKVSFQWEDLPWNPGEGTESYMGRHSVIKKAYYDDRGCLDRCDALIMVYPAGFSSHLELGTALGQNKPTFIYGDLSTLKPEVWYMGVNGIYKDDEIASLIEALKTLSETEKPTSNFP
jgi:hypothetical protein